MQGLVLFAHGARDPYWATPFQRLQQIVAAQCGDRLVMLAYLERMLPTLAEAVSVMVGRGIDTIHIAPLFLGPGAHFREDFPALMDGLRAQYPHLNLTSLAVLGESDTLLHAIADWVAVEIAPT